MDRNVCINQVFRDTGEDKVYRILWVSQEADLAYWIDLENKSSIPSKMRLSMINEAIESGRLIHSDEPFCLMAELTETEKEHRDRLWEMTEPPLLDEPGIYDRGIRKNHLERIEKESVIKKQNLYPYLARYWKGGKTPNAFVPDYKKCGAKGGTRTGTNEKPAGHPMPNRPLGKL